MLKRKRLVVILGVILVCLILLVNFFRQQYLVPIVMYHSVDPLAAAENRLAVRAATFDRQMHFLKTHHYNVLTLDSLVDLIKEKKKTPKKTIAITFDDGYKDFYFYAFPVLKKYNLPATMFIIVNEVGRLQNDRLSWEEIWLMQDSGIISFASHAIGPDPLVKIQSEDQLRYQIFDSKKILEEKLGRQVKFFSYPEGMFNQKIRQLVIDAGYKAAVATKSLGYPPSDIFALKRLRISENCANLFIFAVETSGYYTFMKEWNKKRHAKK